MNKRKCYIPTVNGEQLGVFLNHEAAQISAIKQLIITADNEIHDKLPEIILRVILDDQDDEGYVYIEETFMYE